jgi:hypothetical protein
VDFLNAFLRPAINVGVASMKFSHFEAFPCLSAGGYSTDKSTAKNSKIHSDIHREIHSSINRYPQLNPQLKLGGGEGGYDLSPSLGPWAVEIHFRYSTFFHAGFVGPLQTYSYNRTPNSNGLGPLGPGAPVQCLTLAAQGVSPPAGLFSGLKLDPFNIITA